jgi:hypothetical protein
LRSVGGMKFCDSHPFCERMEPRFRAWFEDETKPQGLKPLLLFGATARLMPCPFKTAICEALW